ncbi:MAG: sulfatase [Paenibacillaceae bacterium]|nr:sulfatase [Paenibacillaceae bacterium]
MSQKKPNILVVISDHFQSKVALPEHPCLTPNIGRLVSEGMHFTHAYTTTSICAPARASMMTGLYPTAHGIYNNYQTEAYINKRLFEGIRIFPQNLVEAGYRNYYYGKWHVTDQSQDELGFIPDPPAKGTVRTKPYKSIKNPGAVLIKDGYADFPLYGEFDGSLEETNDYQVAARAAERIGMNAQEEVPWCIFASLNAPHPPYGPTKEFLQLYEGLTVEKPSNFDDDMKDKPGIYRRLKKELWAGLSWEQCAEAIKHIYASSSMVDFLVGMLLDKLDETGQTDHTMVVFLSDHGELSGAHGMFTMGVVPFDETYRIPIIVRWPGKIGQPGTRCDKFVRITDIAPTLLEAAGAKPLDAIGGRSLVPLLEGRTPEDWPDEVFCMFNGTEFLYTQRMIFDRKFKYVFNAFDFDELYDLEADPGETVNLSELDEYEPVKKELSKRMWKWMKKEKDIFNNLNYPFLDLMPVGPDEDKW